jgi:hypothetical protein
MAAIGQERDIWSNRGRIQLRGCGNRGLGTTADIKASREHGLSKVVRVAPNIKLVLQIIGIILFFIAFNSRTPWNCLHC